MNETIRRRDAARLSWTLSVCETMADWQWQWAAWSIVLWLKATYLCIVKRSELCRSYVKWILVVLSICNFPFLWFSPLNSNDWTYGICTQSQLYTKQTYKHTYELIPIQTENEYSNLCFMEANIIWVCCTRSCVQKLMAHETSFISY